MFWGLLKYVVLKALQQIFIDNHLQIYQRLGIICLISKEDKDKRHLTNCIPLTLLDSFYKIIFTILAKRLKPVLDNLQSHDQKVYISGDLSRNVQEQLMTHLHTQRNIIYLE